MLNNSISRQDAIGLLKKWSDGYSYIEVETNTAIKAFENLPLAEPEEVIPHRNYKYLSDYWCECGWHLGKKGDVKYCADCGRKVNWDE